MARERSDPRRSSEARGSHRTGTERDPRTEKLEAYRRGGGGYDAGPGDEQLPSASDLDRPPSPCGTFGRTGSSRGGIDEGIRKIQDQERRGR